MPKFLTAITICFLLLVIIILVAYIQRIPYKTKPFSRKIINRNISDSTVTPTKDFLISSPLITVKSIHSGNVIVPLSNALNLKHPASSNIPDKELEIPVFAYLIHHEKYGYYLIDSGCSSSYTNNAFGSMKGLILPLVMCKTTLTPEQAIERQLPDIKNNLKGIFFTHLHFDHTSGLETLPKNLTYVAGKGEESLSVKWLLEPNHFKKSDTIYMIDFDSEYSQNLPLGKAVDIFGDQTLWAISTPGHSKGHVSYLVNTQEHPVLITGDACILKESLKIGVGPGTSSQNIESAQSTFEKILKFSKENPQVEIWPGHDYPD